MMKIYFTSICKQIFIEILQFSDNQKQHARVKATIIQFLIVLWKCLFITFLILLAIILVYIFIKVQYKIHLRFIQSMGANCFGQQAKKEKQRLEKKRKQMQEKKRIQDQQLKRMFFQYLLAKQREAQQRNQIPQFPSGLVQQIQIQQQVISSCDSQDAKNLSDSKSKKYSSKLQIINKNSKIKFNQHNNDVKKSKLGHDNDGNNEKNQQVNQEQNDNSNINKDEQKNKQNIKKDQKVNNDQNNKGMLSKFLNSVIDYFKQSPDKQIQKKAFMTKVIVKNHQKECTKQTEIIYSKIDNEIKWLNDPSDSSFKIKQYQIKEVDFQTLPLSERQKIQQIYKKMIKKENNKNQDKKGNKQKSFQKSVY